LKVSNARAIPRVSVVVVMFNAGAPFTLCLLAAIRI
jgi:hypothetical protein